MKKFLRRACAAALSAALVCGAMPLAAFAAPEAPAPLKIAALSDTHLFLRDMIKGTEDYQAVLDSDRKMLTESEAVTDAMLQQIDQEDPDVLLISGDLTKDGEQRGHEALAQKLETLKKANPGMHIYVINGNHDVNNSYAMDFNTADGNAVAADKTTPAEFRDIYGDVSYEDPSVIATYTPPAAAQAGGLSYVARPKAGYTFIVIDSGRYSSDNTSSGKDEHETGGQISADLEKWILEQIRAAKARGDVVMGMEHHGVVPHFSKEPEVMTDYLVNDYARLGQAFADAGMSYVFTGHMHANDIAEMTTQAGSRLVDIETGSAVTYPSPRRTVTIDRVQDGGKVTSTMQVGTHTGLSVPAFPDPVNGGQHEAIADLTAYGKDNPNSKLTDTLVCGMVSRYLTEACDKIQEQGGSKKALDALLLEYAGSDVDTLVQQSLLPELKKYLEQNLPAATVSTQAELAKAQQALAAMPAQARAAAEVTLGYDKEAEKLVISAKVSIIKLHVGIPVSALPGALDGLLTSLDQSMQHETGAPSALDTIVENALKEILAVPVNPEAGAADQHTLVELANYTYQTHLAGDENGKQEPAWVTTGKARLEDGSLVDTLVNQAVDSVVKGVIDFTGQVDLADLTNIAGMKKNEDGYAVFTPVDSSKPMLIEMPTNESGLLIALVLSDSFDKNADENGVMHWKDGVTLKTLLDKAGKFGLDVQAAASSALKDLLNGTEEKEGVLTSEMRQKASAWVSDLVVSMTTDENNTQDSDATYTTVENAADRTALQTLYDANKDKQQGNYTDSSWADFTDALQKAATLLQKEDATQPELNAARDALQAAIGGLTEKPEMQTVVTLANGEKKTITHAEDIVEIPQSSTFTVELASSQKLDAFRYNPGTEKIISTGTVTPWDGTKGTYTIYGLGDPNAQQTTTGVYVNGKKLFNAKVVKRPLTSDTTVNITKKVGQSYVFRVTPAANRPSFTFSTANGSMLETSIVKGAYPAQDGGYYCRITVKKPGDTVGVYCNINGSTYKLFAVTCIK